MKVVVYGTLKRGYSNHSLLEDAEFISDVDVDGYKLFYSFGDKGFPVAKPCEDSVLKGEIFEIPLDRLSILAGLDQLEGEGSMYHRLPVLEGEAEMYVGDNRFWGGFKDMTECPKVDGKYVWGVGR